MKRLHRDLRAAFIEIVYVNYFLHNFNDYRK
jgi:hypothetical protein